MVSLEATWLGPHSEVYRRILERVTRLPEQSAQAFLAGPVYKTLNEILDFGAYEITAGGEATASTTTRDGAPVVYWDGETLAPKPFNRHDRTLGQFYSLAAKIEAMTAGYAPAPLIVDLGAGTGVQTVALRASGSDLPVLCLDLFKPAIEIAERLCSKLGVDNVAFAPADLSAPEGFPDVADVIRRCAGPRPIIVISRYAIYPFYTEAEYAALFDFLIRDLKAVGGIHLERTGRFTPTFAKLSAQLPSPLPIPEKHKGKTDDPLAHLIGRADIKIAEHTEILPGYLDSYYPRYLSWTRG